MSSETISKLGKNENLSMESLDTLCEVLESNIKDLIEFVPNNNKEDTDN